MWRHILNVTKFAVAATINHQKKSAKMNNQQEQAVILATKSMEQVGATVGTSLGLYQLIVQHKDLILTLCTIGSFGIAVLGYFTSTVLNWYFKSKHLKLSELQVRRREDNKK